MHECGEVDQLDDHRKIDMTRIDLAGCAPGEKRHQRSKTFAASADRVGHIAFNGWVKSCRLLNNSRFDEVELRLHKRGHSSQRVEPGNGRRNASPART